jgi:hypothetical protein
MSFLRTGTICALGPGCDIVLYWLGYELNGRGLLVEFPAVEKNFFLLLGVQSGAGTH